MLRDEFLEQIQKRMDEMVRSGGSGRDLSNFMLVSVIVKHVLHRTALIVCKRNWRVGKAGEAATADFVATWTLGMYLKHSGVMSVQQGRDF